jgi:4-amino-4-deoxy-L-arabinose transferase-like glycosyltransferase
MAAVFLLKGMAVLMPLSIVFAVEAARYRAKPGRWIHLWVAVPTFVLPVGLWGVLRWRVDEWQFLKRVVYDDFVGHAFDVLDGHAKSPFFHLNVLQKQEYGWLLVAAMALLLLPMHLYRWRGQLSLRRDAAGLRVLLGVWAGITLLVPTLMRTKLPWYLNPFYPAFALGVAWLLAHGLSHAGSPRRRLALGLAIALVFVAAEGRLAWYSFHYRDLGRSVQGILLTERVRLSGRVVFGPRWENADNFVLGSLIGAEGRVVCDSNEFLHSSAPGDYLVSATDLAHPTLALVRTNGRHWLYRRVELAAQASR